MVADRKALLLYTLDERSEHDVAMTIGLYLLLLEDCLVLRVIFEFESHVDSAYRRACLLNWLRQFSLESIIKARIEDSISLVLALAAEIERHAECLGILHRLLLKRLYAIEFPTILLGLHEGVGLRVDEIIPVVGH